MSEILELDDLPTAASNNQQSSTSESKATVDKHLPTFDFDGYPDIEEDSNDKSPRIIDDQWKKYEIQSSSDETGATNLRHDSHLLDKLIPILQFTVNDLKSSDKKHLLQVALKVLANILVKGKCED